jgi:uncharacterized protein YacL
MNNELLVMTVIGLIFSFFACWNDPENGRERLIAIFKMVLTTLVVVFFSFDLFQDALKQHEKLLQLSPAEQAEVLEAWHEESEARAEYEETQSDFDP